MEQTHGEVLLYQADDGKTALDVRLERETVWLTQAQMVDLFQRDQSVISRHINNVFKEGELVRETNMQKMHIGHSDKPVAFFSLDVIISVGYRVRSQRGTQFRIWATQVLRDHLVKGYTLHERMLKQRGVAELEQAIQLLSRTLVTHSLVDDTGRAILDVVEKYARSWRLLVQFDEQKLPILKGHSPTQKLDTNTARNALDQLKKKLVSQKEAGDLFGMDRKGKLDAILEGLDQTFSGNPLYKSTESRAAHLLYFIIKDHPFTDGNKRIGSLLFLLYLEANGLLDRWRINDTALVALALLIAESAPGQKELMIRLVENLLSVE